ncbi:hypothetical protein [Pelagerythrobacter aerophilus]|uniref:hypothetical protein n=1 Tax=Pelagerythrobacter aerophilus TaxID=2306995 RepID=UPI001602FE08|nr:hypothetical protein [Pelagerythrobacter aerophilus]
MNIPPSEAEKLALYEYQALFHNWQLAHETEETLEPPSIEETLERRAHLEARGIKVLH